MDLLLALCVVAMVTCCCGFNLDLETVTVHQGEPGSMFGYTVAQHQDGPVSW